MKKWFFCLIALLFNDYSNIDTKFYTDMKENKNQIFTDLSTSIMINHRVEMSLAVYKLFKNNIVKLTSKNIDKQLYLTKLFDPLVSEELFKFYIKWKLNAIPVDI